jgi:BirA family biotin operon repressor/biotin-[acetyl-CoA-carboxylase] ligase
LKSSLPDEQRAQPVPPDLKEVWARAGPRLGPFADRLHCLSTIPSTNDLALRLADAGAKEGTTLLAEAQTAGRGRRGREWFSPPGSGIYVSVILRPSFTPPSFDDPLEPEHRVRAPITLAAGVALAEGVRASTGLPVELKWPNDLVCERRKLAGILAEMATTGSDGWEAVVLGIGINVRAAAYPPELAATATSLEAELGRPIDRALVLVETLAALASRYADLQAGRFDAILTAWRGLARSLPGAPVEWDGPAGVVRGLAIDIDSDGTLLARTETGIARLVAGEVRWR